MPNNALLALILLAGFWFINQFHLTRFRAQTLDGYRLLMESAGAGVFLLILAQGITYLPIRVPPIGQYWHDKVTAEPYAGTVVVAFSLGCLLPVVFNFFYSAEKAKRRAIDRYGNYQLRILQEATSSERPVSITLGNGKVYIGTVAYFPNLDAKDTFLGIVPFFSGHREKDSLVLTLDTEYLSKYSTGGYNPADFVVALSTADIKMLSFFDDTAMEAFNLNRPQGPAKVPGNAGQKEAAPEKKPAGPVRPQ